MHRVLKMTALAISFCFGSPVAAYSQDMHFVRDAEIETTLRSYADPIFEAARLDPESIRIFIIQDEALNAFVAGRNIAVHTGLIRKLETPSALIGVIAHETGHIAGGHLSRRQKALEKTQGPRLLAAILAIAAATAGEGEAGMALLAGAQHVTKRNFLAFSRSEESAADQAAITYMNAVGVPPDGVLSVLEELQQQEIFVSERMDPYTRTHPLSRNRLSALKNRAADSPYSGAPEDPEFQYWHDRMLAKLDGFLLDPIRVFQKYPKDGSETSLMAQAVAYHRLPDPARAVATVDRLIAKRPDDPYYWELKGQILLEGGDPVDAYPAYKRAFNLAPDSALIAVSYAQTLLALDTDEANGEANRVLASALREEKLNASAWRQKSIAETRLGNEAEAALATAEFMALKRNKKLAIHHAKRARDTFPAGSPGALRAHDLLAYLDYEE